MDHVLTFVLNFIVQDVGSKLQKKASDALVNYLIPIIKSILSCVWLKLTARSLAALIVFSALLLLFTYWHKILLCIQQALNEKKHAQQKKTKVDCVGLWQKKNIFLIVVLLMVAYDIYSCFVTTCDILHSIDNGSIECVGSWCNNSVGVNCSFACDESYQLMGEKEIECNQSGNWSHEVPKCIKICDKLPKVQHGELECNGTVAGSVCTVKCDELYKVEGIKEIKCNEAGKWSHGVPKCVKIFDKLPEVPHGKLKCSSTLAGSVCCVKRDELQRVEDFSRMVCDRDGRWSGGIPDWALYLYSIFLLYILAEKICAIFVFKFMLQVDEPIKWKWEMCRYHDRGHPFGDLTTFYDLSA